MIFQHTWQQVMDGSKTQTRRLVKPHERGPYDQHGNYSCVMRLVDSKSNPFGRWIYPHELGKTYAVCPGRGKAAIGRIKITGIRREHVQDISEADARAEGCKPQSPHPWGIMPYQSAKHFYYKLWDSIHTKKGERWADNPEVWVLEFELVEDEPS